MTSHNTARANLFRPSKKFNVSVDNPFFGALEDSINTAFVDDSLKIERNIEDYYICNRKSGCDQATIDSISSRLPDDVIAFLKNCTNKSEILPAYFEIDLVDFLLNVRSNKVLSIVGSIGVGKSTYLGFVLKRMVRECPSLNCFFPIIIDGLFIGDNQPLHTELALRIHEDCKAATHRHLSPNEAVQINESLDGYLAKQLRMCDSRANSTTISLYLSYLKKSMPGKTVIVIFDNLDQLDSNSVAKISHLARAIYLQDGDPVILSMRPPTFAKHVETDANCGAFYTFRIALAPPNIKEIVNRRVERIFPSNTPITVSDHRSGFRISLPSKREAVTKVSDNILNPNNQNLMLLGLSNNNIRRSLLCFQNFLRFSELDFRSLFGVQIETRSKQEYDERRHSWDEHFLKGIMLSGRKYFLSSRSSVVSNIFYLDSNDFGLSYTILYRLLSACYWARGLISKYSLVKWMTEYQYNEGHVDIALKALLNSQLLSSPDHEFKVQNVSHVSISESGRYYMEELLSDQTYLYEAVCDIPLEHHGWRHNSHEDFHQRSKSIVEYLGAVIATEREECLAIHKSSQRAKLLGIVLHSGLLSRRIHTCAKSVAEIGRRARSTKVIRVAEELDRELIKVNQLISEMEVKLRSNTRAHNDRNITNTPQNPKHSSWRLGDVGEFVFEYPVELSPDSNNLLRAQLSLKFDNEPDVLMVHLVPERKDNGANIGTLEAMWPLKKQRLPGKYTGETTLFDIDGVGALFPATITVFADSRAMFTRDIK